MLRFPIDKEIRINHEPFSEFHLNDEWIISGVWIVDEIAGKFLRINIKTDMEIISEEISIFGTLALKRYNVSQGTVREFISMEFFKLLKGCSHQILVDLYPKSKFDSTYYFEKFDALEGVVNIVFDIDKCTTVFPNGKSDKCIQPESLIQLSNDLERLLDPQNYGFSDVSLVCGDVSLPVHKNILSARSPVFAAMFKNPMKENRENQVDITDIDESVLRAMLLYIYSGKTSNLTVSTASDLLFAADKYQLEDLKKACCHFLMSNVTLQNIIRLLVLGDLHAEELKSFAMDYISKDRKRFSEIEETEEWITLRKDNPSLAMDVLTFLLKARDKN